MPQFQPAPPARRATCVGSSFPARRPISTRAPRTEGDLGLEAGSQVISTRAPRTEGDTRRSTDLDSRSGISTRAPRTEGDFALRMWSYFNPRPPHGGRRPAAGATDREPTISTRAPRTEGDSCERLGPVSIAATLISTRAPRTEGDSALQDTAPRPSDDKVISTRAPRTEGDPDEVGVERSLRRDFNPRPPHGGRPQQRI